MPEEKYIITANLKVRGWTDRLIRVFLGEPDQFRQNPHYRRGAPMRCYALSRVEAVEATEEFAAEREKTEQRRKASAKGITTRSNNMDAAMKAAEIKIVPGKTRDEIRLLAAATHGGNFRGDPGQFHFDNRIAVNCIRHNLTNYESLWELCNRGETGTPAYETLRERVDDLIRQTYPEYFE